MSELSDKPRMRFRREITPQDYDMILKLAPIAHASGAYGTASADDAAMRMFEGIAIGFNYIAALKHVRFFQGRTQLSAEGMLALTYASDMLNLLKFETLFDESGIAYQSTVALQRRDENALVFERTFTTQMARIAQLMKPDSNWIKWHQNMLEWRAFTWTFRLAGPDIAVGLIPYFELDARGQPPEQITIVNQDGKQIPVVKQLPEACDHFSMLKTDAACPQCGWPNPNIAVLDSELIEP